MGVGRPRKKPTLKKNNVTTCTDIKEAESAIEEKGWERTMEWSLVSAKRKPSGETGEWFTWSYTSFKNRQDRERKKNGIRCWIKASDLPGETWRWSSADEAELAQPRWVAAIEKSGNQGRRSVKVSEILKKHKDED